MITSTIILFATLAQPIHLDPPQPHFESNSPIATVADHSLNRAPFHDRKIYREDGLELTDEQKAIADRFNATEVCFKEDGRVSLRYEFESKNEALLDDWQVRAKKRQAVRWSQRYEGSTTHSHDGLIIADSGAFLHNANWLDAKVELDYLSIAGTRSQDLLAAVFVFDKGRRAVGSHIGEQCVQLKGLKRTSKCIPRKNEATLAHDRRVRFGFELDKGVVKSTLNGVPTNDSHKDPKFTRKLTPGKSGLVWQGRVQGFILDLTIEGRLDPKWIASGK
ncbi:MAG: hypothetical protein AAF488_06690 [Planctomycetota bacterium]